jgi:hypothetical protein
MKLKFRSSLFVTLSLFLALTSCKKDSQPQLSDEETDLQIATHVNDESMTSLELDQSVTDASVFLEYNSNFNGNNTVLSYGPCDVETEYDLESDPKTITLTFNGDTECSSKRIRTGKIIISMAKNAYWTTAGAVATLKYENFKVVRTSDNKSITINGTKTFTNVSGKLYYDLYEDGVDSLVRTTASSNMSVKVDSTVVRQWQIARKYAIKYDQSYNLLTKITGTHTEGNTTGIAEWGTNRFGNSFVTIIDAPVVINPECSKLITGGTVTHKTAAYSVTATFGLNSEGVATSCPGEGSYYYKLQATAGVRTYNGLIAY